MFNWTTEDIIILVSYYIIIIIHYAYMGCYLEIRRSVVMVDVNLLCDYMDSY